MTGKVALRSHPSTNLSDGSVTPETLRRTINRTEELLNALRDGYVTRIGFVSTALAPEEHPDAFPATDGVRRDGLSVLQVTAEVKDGYGLHQRAALRVDPVGLLLDIFNRQHPNTEVLIEYRPPEQMPTPESTPLNDDDQRPAGTGDLPAAGCTIWPADGRHAPTIWLNTELPVSALAEVLAEELAHVVAGPAAQHGPEFEAALDRLVTEFEPRARILNWERYLEPLPVSVQAYLDGHPERRLEIRPTGVSLAGRGTFVSFIYSEHGWPLSSHRYHSTSEAAVRGLVHEQPIRHVSPRISEDGLRYC